MIASVAGLLAVVCVVWLVMLVRWRVAPAVSELPVVGSEASSSQQDTVVPGPFSESEVRSWMEEAGLPHSLFDKPFLPNSHVMSRGFHFSKHGRFYVAALRDTVLDSGGAVVLWNEQLSMYAEALSLEILFDDRPVPCEVLWKKTIDLPERIRRRVLGVSPSRVVQVFFSCPPGMARSSTLLIRLREGSDWKSVVDTLKISPKWRPTPHTWDSVLPLTLDDNPSVELQKKEAFDSIGKLAEYRSDAFWERVRDPIAMLAHPAIDGSVKEELLAELQRIDTDSVVLSTFAVQAIRSAISQDADARRDLDGSDVEE